MFTILFIVLERIKNIQFIQNLFELIDRLRSFVIDQLNLWICLSAFACLEVLVRAEQEHIETYFSNHMTALLHRKETSIIPFKDRLFLKPKRIEDGYGNFVPVLFLDF